MTVEIQKNCKSKTCKNEITGDLSEYLQVVEHVYEIIDDFGSKLSKRIKTLNPICNKEYEVRILRFPLQFLETIICRFQELDNSKCLNFKKIKLYPY